MEKVLKFYKIQLDIILVDCYNKYMLSMCAAEGAHGAFMP